MSNATFAQVLGTPFPTWLIMSPMQGLMDMLQLDSVVPTVERTAGIHFHQPRLCAAILVTFGYGHINHV